MAAGLARARPHGPPPGTAAAAVVLLLLRFAAAPHGAAAATCPDFQPPGDYTCAEQAGFGKCGAPWMVAGGFCQQTCGRCPTGAAASPAEEELRAALASQRLVLTPLVLPNATVPAAERPTPPPRRPSPAAERPAPAAERSLQPTRRPAPAAERPAQLPRRPVPPPGAEAVQVLPAVAFLPPLAEPNATRPLPAVPFLFTAPAAEAAPRAEPGCDAGKTAWAALSADPDLSITRQAVQALNLTSVLQSPNLRFTIFAPTNEAWTAAAREQGQTPPQLLAAAPAARDLLFTHVVPNRVINARQLANLRFVIPQSNVPLFVEPGPQGTRLLSPGGAARVADSPVLGCTFALYKIHSVLRSTPAPGQALNNEYAAALSSGAGAGAVPAPTPPGRR